MLQTNTRKSPRGHCVSGQWKTLQLALICHRLRESQATKFPRYLIGRSAASVTRNHKREVTLPLAYRMVRTKFIPAAFANG